ncbi:MAG: DUF1292 domain-containing protein [Lachnospiraceae bacterium]|nr:DUF1292 domain-containing protein [Candidatus Equihabitans merdae]
MSDINNNEEFEEFEDLGTVTLTMEDDTEVDYAILAIYPVNDRQYIALQPVESDDLNDVIFYRYILKSEDEDPEIEYIDDDEEYEQVLDAFDEILDENMFEDAE